MFQWDSNLKVSTWFMVYRVAMALVFLAELTARLAGAGGSLSKTIIYQPEKYWIFLTNQGFVLLTASYIFRGGIVFARWFWERSNSDTICKSMLAPRGSEQCSLLTEHLSNNTKAIFKIFFFRPSSEQIKLHLQDIMGFEDGGI